MLADARVIREDHPGCGVEKIYHTLAPPWIGRDKCCQLLLKSGFRLKKHVNRCKTTNSVKSRYQNLIEGMLLTNKNQLWQSDITYFETGGRWFYLVFIIDAYTKVIVGYSASENLKANSNIAALKMAFKSQGITALNNLIHHSDYGSQYHQNEYIEMLNQKSILISMGRKGQENAYAERINGTIKNEYLKSKSPRTLNELKRVLKNKVDHYNNKRIHKSLPNKRTPKQFENELLNLTTQKRPKVIVYTDGKPNLKAALSRIEVYPEKDLQAPVCPMVYN